MEDKDRLLSTRECSAASGYHQTHFNSQIQAGKLKATKDEKGRWQVKQSDLDKYLSDKTVKPRRKPAFTEGAAGEGNEKSLLTQLDEKTKAYENLQLELGSAKQVIDELKSKHSDQITEFRKTISELEKKLEIRGRKIERLEALNDDLQDRVDENQNYLKETLNNVLQYMMK